MGSSSKTEGPDPALINLTALLLQSSLVMRIILSLGEQAGVGVWTPFSVFRNPCVMCLASPRLHLRISVCPVSVAFCFALTLAMFPYTLLHLFAFW